MDYLLIGIGVAFIVWNFITFMLYASDKRRAVKKAWRIKERTLILCGFLMGGIGALMGMYMLRHKTQHLMFKILVPLSVLLNIAAIVMLVCFMY